MHGVPGFETGATGEDFAFVSMSEDEALELSDIWFGVRADSATRLDTERDDSFVLETSHGRRVLKVAHPADSGGAIEMQLAALQHAARADVSLPLQSIVRTPGGGLWLETPGGRIARMLDWLPGILWSDAPGSAAQLTDLGDALGRLSVALSSFTDERAVLLSAWDLQTIPRLGKLLDADPEPHVAQAIARFERHVAPRLSELPTQIIHNDFNPGNVLVDPADPRFVVGILDFGDVVHSLRVADLAIAISYALFPLRHSWSDVTSLVTGFERHVPLTDAERDVLPALVAGRLAQRILLNTWLAKQEGDTYRDREPMISALSAVLDLEA